MGRHFRVRSVFTVLLVCLVSMFILAAGAVADTGAKNNGIEVKAKAASGKNNGVVATKVDSAIPAGARVKAIVDHPSGSDCIRTGYTGTMVCYDPNDPVLPYLVNWDEACGFEQCQVCGVCAPNGWWVGFNEIAEVGGPDPGIIPTGSTVRAIVDNPSGSDCITTGDTGTLVCYDPDDPVLPYLVDWDVPCGFEQCQVCGVCATNGWWVGFGEIEATTGPVTQGLSGCVELDGQAVVNRPVVLKQPTRPQQQTKTDSNGCYEFANPTRGKSYQIIIRGAKIPLQ